VGGGGQGFCPSSFLDASSCNRESSKRVAEVEAASKSMAHDARHWQRLLLCAEGLGRGGKILELCSARATRARATLAVRVVVWGEARVRNRAGRIRFEFGFGYRFGYKGHARVVLGGDAAH
jgi:hypothetical protein